MKVILDGWVFKSTGSWYRVRLKDGQFIDCRVRGKLKLSKLKTTNPVAVGDDVELTLDEKFRRNEGIIKSKVSNVITSYFNVDNREFGEIFYPDDVARQIFTTVPEVRVASVMNFKDRVNLEFNEILQLNNFSVVFRYV